MNGRAPQGSASDTLPDLRRPPSPKRHHYVPQLLQKRFVDQEGWLHAYSRAQPERGVYRSRPENLFVETHLYSEIDEAGCRHPAMELRLSELESQAEPVIARMVEAARTGQVPSLSAKEKEVWFVFFALQWKRVPDMRKDVMPDADLAKLFDDLIAEVSAAAPHLHADIDALNTPAARRRLMQNARVDVVDSLSPEVLDAIRSRGIALIRPNRPDKQFLIGSRPVVKLTAPGKTHIRHPECEMWLPIAGDVAIGLGRGRGDEVLVPATADDVRHINLAAAMQSSTIAGKSPRHVLSIARPR